MVIGIYLRKRIRRTRSGAALQMALSILAFLSPISAFASPYEVDDLGAATTVELSLSTGFESGSETMLEAPVVDISIPLAQGTEVSFSAGAGRIEPEYGAVRWGRLDNVIGIKWEVLPVPDEGGVGVTFAPTVILPSGSRGLSENEFRAELPLTIGLVRGPYQLRAVVGYARGFETRQNSLLYGVAAELAVSPSLAIGAELSGGMDGFFSTGHSANANIGFVFAVNEELELGGRFGRSLDSDDPDAMYSGLLTVKRAF